MTFFSICEVLILQFLGFAQHWLLTKDAIECYSYRAGFSIHLYNTVRFFFRDQPSWGQRIQGDILELQDGDFWRLNVLWVFFCSGKKKKHNPIIYDVLFFVLFTIPVDVLLLYILFFFDAENKDLHGSQGEEHTTLSRAQQLEREAAISWPAGWLAGHIQRFTGKKKSCTKIIKNTYIIYMICC